LPIAPTLPHGKNNRARLGGIYRARRARFNRAHARVLFPYPDKIVVANRARKITAHMRAFILPLPATALQNAAINAHARTFP
jgi:hypothetical protein